jgi:cyclic pyranopterin phosphate synthase
MDKLTHVDENGTVKMVDTGAKEVTGRVAIAQGIISGKQETIEKIRDNSHKKGDVLTTAHLAAVMAAKKTGNLIPLCHNIPLDSVHVEFSFTATSVKVEVTARCQGRTGVEMEAMTAASVACLTIYDMCKAVDRSMEIHGLCLNYKSGGKSGVYQRES